MEDRFEKKYDLEEILKNPKLSLMMKQYIECKLKHNDCILLYRLGDFYEMFFNDALLASNLLELTLTSRSCGLEERAPMCGIPHHAVESYITKLVEFGYKVAIGEQLEDPKEAKGIVQRDVIRIITPGTMMDEFEDKNSSNFLMAIYSKDDKIGISYIDISAGDIFSTKIDFVFLEEEISKIKPSEIIFSDVFLREKILKVIDDYNIFSNEEFDSNYLNNDIISNYFTNGYISSLEFDDENYIVNSISILLNYIFYTQKKIFININTINIYNVNSFMILDSFTRDSLELTKRLKGNEKQGSLFHILDDTNTAMGARLLKKYIEEPLINKKEIEKRLNLVEELFKDNELRDNLSTILKHVYDMERLCGKIAFEKINPRELVNLKKSIESLPLLKHLIDTSETNYLKLFFKGFDDLRDIFELIDKTILDDPSMTILEGNIIKPSYNKDLERYLSLLNNMADNISKLEEEQKNVLGIKNLKIRKNGADGYYMEITKNALGTKELPIDYKKVKDLTTAFRFTFPSLKELENDIFAADTKAKTLEYELFLEVREKLSKNIFRIKKVSNILANLDVFVALANVSYNNSYTRPSINEDGILEIEGGRHPIIEKMMDVEFISNDTFIGFNNNLIHLITGPNMAGKSTYMRQVVLINLMAQIGCFVPCEKANISICDRIFTRIGASDNLSKGESTFMVEMNEVSHILNNATSKSLIILDEVGRGTSTYDGISLAWAIVEYISKNIKCKTLFATHYFELTNLSEELNNVSNYTILIDEDGESIKFLRKIVKGCANKSYGIHVASFAKLPSEVIIRANELLNNFEKDDGNVDNKITIKNNDLEDEIRNLDLMNMTPMEVFNYLYDLKKKLK